MICFFSVIKCCPQEELASTEQYFMDCYNPFFNSIKTANMYWGYEHSEEIKIRMSKIRTEYNNRPDIAERKRKRMKELWSDDNYREKVIKARLGNKQSQETIDKRVATRAKNGKKETPEMLARKRARKLTPEQLIRHKESHNTPEFLKKNISISKIKQISKTISSYNLRILWKIIQT